MTCQQCNGHGWVSALCHSEIELVTSYDFDRENLRPDVIEVVEEQGAEIRHHSIIGLVERAQDDEKKTQTIEVFYHIKAPIADTTFKLKSLEIPALVFGTQGMIRNTPPFLEKIMGKGMKELQSAAKGQGDVAAHLQNAGRYKTLRLIIMATAKTSPAKALKAVMERTPIGLSEDTAKRLITMTTHALKHIGKKPKMLGIAIGGITAALLFAGFFIFGKAHIPQLPVPPIAIDAAATILSATLGFVIGRAYTKSAVQSALKKLLG